MYGVTHNELKGLIKKSFTTQIPMFIWGATGIGKSRSMKDVTEEMGVGFIDVRLSQLDPSDLRGLPNYKGGRTVWLPPSWLPPHYEDKKKEENNKGIIFLDELNLAPPSIQASAYQLVLDRQIGDYKLPKGWVVMAAGNRAEDRAHVFEMAAPLCNRLIHYELGIPIIDPQDVTKGWTGWAMDNDVDLRLVNFLAKNTSLLYKFKGDTKEKAFPTPRSWEVVSKLIDGEKSLAYIQMLASGTVGEGAATQLHAFLKTSKAINLAAVLKDPKKEVPKLKDVDMKYGLVNELTNWYKNSKRDNKKYVKEVTPVIEILDAEFSIRILQICSQIGGTAFRNALVADKGTDKIIMQYGRYLK